MKAKRKNYLVLLSFAACLLMCVSMLTFSASNHTANADSISALAEQNFSETNGNIYSYNQLLQFAEGTRQGLYRTMNVNLQVDIDLMNNLWTPIQGYSGVFNGNSHVIHNLKMEVNLTNVSTLSYGFFDQTSGTIKKLAFYKPYLSVFGNSNGSAENINIGIISGKSSGTIDQCSVIQSTIIVSAWSAVGGLVGKMESGYILDSLVDGLITNRSFFGGIAGLVTSGTVYSCEFRGDINIDQTMSSPVTGGIVAQNKGTISNTNKATGVMSYVTAKRENDRTVYPHIGKIAGISYSNLSGNTSSMTINKGSLYSFGIVLINRHDQAMYVGGDVGQKI